MQPALQQPGTRSPARLRRCSTWPSGRCGPAVAGQLQLLPARLAGRVVADRGASVATTGERFATLLLTRERLPAPARPLQLPAPALQLGGGPAWRTRSWMTELDTAVDTATVPAADLTTAVRYQTLVPLPVRTSNLATEAAVLVRYSDSDRLTAGAAPASVPRPCRPGPLLNAVEVEDLEAVGTVPGVSCLPHSLQTDHALRRAAAELLRQPGPQVATLFPGPTSHHPCPSPSLHHLLFLFMSVLSADGAGGGQTISHPEIWVWLHVTDAALLS